MGKNSRTSSCGDFVEIRFSQSHIAVQKKFSCGEIPRRDATGKKNFFLNDHPLGVVSSRGVLLLQALEKDTEADR